MAPYILGRSRLSIKSFKLLYKSYDILKRIIARCCLVLSSEFCVKITDPIYNLMSIAAKNGFLMLLGTDNKAGLFMLGIHVGKKSENWTTYQWNLVKENCQLQCFCNINSMKLILDLSWKVGICSLWGSLLKEYNSFWLSWVSSLWTLVIKRWLSCNHISEIRPLNVNVFLYC